ncbi:unnamed protein product [Cutaneotrichosporon oleaginosum]
MPCPHIKTDRVNCGGCGIKDPDPYNPNAKCLDIRSDKDNCGGCNYLCAWGASCSDSTCKCPPGTSVCDSRIVAPPGWWRGACQDLMSDRFNCGGCGKVCDGNCVNGVCEKCPPGQVRCNSGCVHLQNDNFNCGRCYEWCSEGSNCVNGKCEDNNGCGPGQIRSPALALVARQEACPTGETSCRIFGNWTGDRYACTDVATDSDNCGRCERSCYADRFSSISVSCAGGECLCDGAPACDNFCPNFQTNMQHCGACDNWVSEDEKALTQCGENGICVNGTCEDCGPGKAMCNIYPGDVTLCVDILNDPAHCSACENACPEGVPCVNGACACAAPQLWCPSTGWCTNATTDRSHCGACDNQCPGQGGYCLDGKCTKCPGNQWRCYTDDRGEICVDTKTDNSNCGGCGPDCSKGEVCRDAQCMDKDAPWPPATSMTPEPTPEPVPEPAPSTEPSKPISEPNSEAPQNSSPANCRRK